CAPERWVSGLPGSAIRWSSLLLSMGCIRVKYITTKLVVIIVHRTGSDHSKDHEPKRSFSYDASEKQWMRFFRMARIMPARRRAGEKFGGTRYRRLARYPQERSGPRSGSAFSLQGRKTPYECRRAGRLPSGPAFLSATR